MSEEKVVAEPTNTAEPDAQEVAEKFYGKPESEEGAKPNEEPKGESEEEAKPEDSEESDADQETESAESEEDKDSEEEKKGDEDSSDKKESKAPDKYDFEVDDDDPITDEQLGEIAQYAKAQGLPNKEAQKIVDMQSSALKAFKENQLEDFKQTTIKWKEETAKDPEIGGDKFTESVALSKAVLDRFGNQQLKEELVNTGLGNHKELVRVFAKIGRAMKNDELVKAGAQASTQKTAEEIFYPSSSNNN